MSSIWSASHHGKPSGPRYDDPADDARAALGHGAGAEVRWLIATALHREALTRELAAGAPPGLSGEMALRAAQLTGPRRRRQLMRAWRDALAEARRPAIPRISVPIVRRGAVLEAEPAIRALMARLADDRPVSAHGMAMLHQVMTDGVTSPLYAASAPGGLHRRLLEIIKALEPDDAGSTARMP